MSAFALGRLAQAHIVQRGAVQPLINMLQAPDMQLREMSAFALGRLAQDTHNQAGIAQNGGMVPLLKLLDSRNGSLQHKLHLLYLVLQTMRIMLQTSSGLEVFKNFKREYLKPNQLRIVWQRH